MVKYKQNYVGGLMKKKPLFSGVEWDVPLLTKMWQSVDKIGKSYGLSYLEPRIELVTAQQMMDSNAAIGLPHMYSHWSFGKDILRTRELYSQNKTSLAYESIINSDPPIAYFMENNSATMQILVMAHACVGHADFFRNNYLFQQYTRPELVTPYCKYAKQFIERYEDSHGAEDTSLLLDAAHALRYSSIDKYIRSDVEYMSKKEDSDIETYNCLNEMHDLAKEDSPSDIIAELNEVCRRLMQSDPVDGMRLPEENLLHFIAKHSPTLSAEEREVLNIVRNMAQYFYPQIRTKVMNEGWASFWHHTIMTDLHNQGLIDDGSYLEFLHSHTGVIRQANIPMTPVKRGQLPPPDERGYNGINPYALGFAMFKDIRRICESPDAEDEKWFPRLVNTDWKKTLMDIRSNYVDSSFILQFLSPKVIRQFKFMSIEWDSDGEEYYDDEGGSVQIISAVHDDDDIKHIRRNLSEQYNAATQLPSIEVTACDLLGDRVLHLTHASAEGRTLSEDSTEVLDYVRILWGYDVELHTKQ